MAKAVARLRRPSFVIEVGVIAAAALALAGPARAEPGGYRAVDRWARLPEGSAWGTMSAVDVDAEGRVYALQRGEPSSKVMVFSPDGRLLRTWGEGAFPDAHGLRVDPHGDVWITDRKLQQVLKFTADGSPLLAIGARGVSGDNQSRTALNGPSDVAFDGRGDVFVTDGESTNARVLEYDRAGRLLRFWGSRGAGPDQLDVPHSLAIDRRGRLFIADRGNRRVQIFSEEGAHLGEIRGVGAPYGVAVDRNDVLYVVDGSKGAEGLTVLSAEDGRVLDRFSDGLEGAHMLAVDGAGAIYVAEVRGRSIRKFKPEAPRPRSSARTAEGEGEPPRRGRDQGRTSSDPEAIVPDKRGAGADGGRQ